MSDIMNVENGNSGGDSLMEAAAVLSLVEENAVESQTGAGTFTNTKAEKKNSSARNASKMDRKNARKSSKMTQIVSRQTGVAISSDPSEWLVVWGLGIANGVSKEMIFEFTPRPSEVRMFVDQSYAFVRCFNEVDAGVWKEKYHGTSYNETQTMYVGFVERSVVIPEEDAQVLSPFHEDLPEGLLVIPNFISEKEEMEFTKKLFVEESSGMQLKKRSVRHFGYEFRYGTNDVDMFTPLPENIPDYIMPSVGKMVTDKVIQAEPDQLTVNQYYPGQGIPPHCDTHSCFEGPILSLSLGSKVVMDFRQANRVVSLVLPSRSLLAMSGESRFGWTHGITPRKYDVIPDEINGGLTVHHRYLRISLTFRRLQRDGLPCRCLFPILCDSQKGRITDDNAPSLENDLVHKVYEEIAGHFTETRHKPWPRVKQFVESLGPGSRLLDVGCANGKYFGINKDIFEIGNDMSLGLLAKCAEKGHEVVRANALSLPFPDNYFDGVISIAVLHHIATKERRLLFLEEILRVMTPEGRGLIYVWAKEQNLADKKSTWSERQTERGCYNPPDVCAKQVADYTFLPVHDREQEFPENDMLVPWVNNQAKQSAVHHRYYHVFTKGELEELVLEMKRPPTIIDNYYEQGNWVVLMEKPS